MKVHRGKAWSFFFFLRYSDLHLAMHDCAKCFCQGDSQSDYLEEICAIQRPRCGFTDCEYPLTVRQLYLKRLFICYAFPLLLDWHNPLCVSGGRTLLSILRWTNFHIGTNFLDDGTDHSWRNFRGIYRKDCLAHQTHLEGRRRNSHKRNRGLFRDHDTGGSGESAGNVAKLVHCSFISRINF